MPFSGTVVTGRSGYGKDIPIYPVDRLVRALDRYRAARKIESFLILAPGASGWFAMRYAQLHPERVRALLLLDTAVDKAAKAPLLNRLGADHFIDYTKTDFTRGLDRYDVIFDMVPGSSYGGCMRSLRSGGRYLAGIPRLSVFFRSVLTTRFSDRAARVGLAERLHGRVEGRRGDGELELVVAGDKWDTSLTGRGGGGRGGRDKEN